MNTMRLTAMSAAVFASALAFAMNSPTAHAVAPQNNDNIVTVQPGDSLSKIAKAEDTTYPRLFYANPNVGHPDVIHAGSKLRVPAAGEELAARPLPGEVVSNVTPAPSQPAQARFTAPQAAPQSVAYNPAPVQVTPAVGGNVWDQLAACESGGDWSTNTGNGYYGGLQFSQASWEGAGGTGLPNQASRAEQIARAEMLQARQGWGAWPACSAQVGLR